MDRGLRHRDTAAPGVLAARVAADGGAGGGVEGAGGAPRARRRTRRHPRGTGPLGGGEHAGGLHRRASAPEDCMNKLAGRWSLVVGGLALALLVAAPALAQEPPKPGARSPKPGEVQTDPIKCWWKADRTAVSVGERFGLTLTCG